MRPSRVVVVLALALVLVLGTAAAWLTYRAGAGADEPQAAARTSFPDLEPAAGAPTLASLTTLHPAAGTVVQAAGPFDDRFHFRGLTFDGLTVSGSTTITSDVSEILELEVVAGFYDRSGSLVGTGRDVYHLDESTADHAEGEPARSRPFRIRVPNQLREVAVAAAVGVPVLVNE